MPELFEFRARRGRGRDHVDRAIDVDARWVLEFGSSETGGLMKSMAVMEKIFTRRTNPVF
jgi:hypothetical protein